MVTFKEFDAKLHMDSDALAAELIAEAKGMSERQVIKKLDNFDKIPVLHDWDQATTLTSLKHLLDFRSIKEQLAESLYCSANYENVAELATKNRINLQSREFYVNSVKDLLATLANK